MVKKAIILITLMTALASAASAQRATYRIANDSWQGIALEFNAEGLEIGQTAIEGADYSTLGLEGYLPSSMEGAPCLPLFSRLIEVPQCDGFEVRITETEYDTLHLTGARIVPAQPSRSKSDTVKHPLVIDSKLYATDAFFGFELAEVETVGTARDRRLARLQFSPVSYNPVSGQLVVCRHAVVNVRYVNADVEATLAHFERYYSPHFASGAAVINSLYPKSVRTAAPVRYLIVAHSSFRGQLNNFVQWKRRKGFITDIVYTDSAAVGTTTSSIAAFIQGQFTNATAAKPAPTYLLIVGDHEQIPAFTGTTSTSHITDLYYISWTAGDNIPDCYCGRFSAQNVAQLTPQIQKTLMYEQYAFNDPSFLDRAVLLAGVDGGSSGDYGYTHADPAMDYAATHYINSTNGFTQVRYYKNNTSITPNAPGVTIESNSTNSATIRNYYNQGAGWINYSAHGSATSWGNPSLTTTNVNSMTNQQKFGLMIGNCCLTNKFETTTCLGEALLRKDNYCGAVGYIGGSNSTYWYEDFYWAVGLRSSVSATMSMAYNASNLGCYDRLCHTHGEAYSQWALTQGAVMMVGNMAVESSTTSRKLYYWEIYHLMGDPSVMPYLTQAATMTVNAPSVVTSGTESISVAAAPYAYVALTRGNSHTLIAAAYANASGQATLSLPAVLSPGDYELAATAQQYQPAFRPVSVIPPSGTYPAVVEIAPANDLVAGATVPLTLRIGNLGNMIAHNASLTLTASSADDFQFTPATLTFDSIVPGDTLTATCNLQVGADVADGTQITILASSACNGMTQPIVSEHQFVVKAPVVNVDFGASSSGVLPGASATLVATVSNSGHAPLVGEQFVLESPTRLLTIEGATANTTAPFDLAPGATTTLTFSLQASSQLPTGIMIPLTITPSHNNETLTHSLFVGVNPAETFESNTFHTTGWTQGSYPWTITNSGAYAGTYCLRSNSTLTHNQTSQISVSVNLSTADSLIFYYSVSSETNYDKFHFLIDNTEKITQSGIVNWTRAAFLIPAGSHTLTFSYSKDVSVNSNSDCAWIDNITLPHQSHPASFNALDLCQGETYTIAGTTLNTTQPGDTAIVRTQNGNIVIVDYSVHPTYNEEQTFEVCDSLRWGNNLYTTSVDTAYTFATLHGCDSSVMLHLTVNHSVANTITDTTYADSYTWNDTPYTQSGTYTQTFTTQQGCDSTITLILTFVDTTTAAIPDVITLPGNSAYPNPTTGMLTLGRTAAEASLYDATGRLLFSGRQVRQLDLGTLPRGIYILRIAAEPESPATTLRIIKQ